eukprot:SAG11_NODE_2666_length_3114_cov_6.157877_4_plen_255_part_00
MILSAELDPVTGERFNCFDADDAQGSLTYIMFERYQSLKDATLKQMSSRMPTPPDNVWSQPGDLTDEEQVLANKMGQDGKKLLKQDEGLSKMQASNLTIAKPILRTLNLAGSNWNAAEQVRDLLGELKTVTSASLSADNAANAKISERIDTLMQQIIAREQDSIEIGSDCFTRVAMRIGAAQAKRADIVFKINACSADVKLEDTSKKTAANWTISSQKHVKLGGMSISEHAAETQKRLINAQKMRGPAQPWGKK